MRFHSNNPTYYQKVITLFLGPGAILYTLFYFINIYVLQVRDSLILRIFGFPIILAPVVLLYLNDEFSKDHNRSKMNLIIFIGIVYTYIHSLFLLYINDFIPIIITEITFGITIQIISLVILISEQIYGKLLLSIGLFFTLPIIWFTSFETAFVLLIFYLTLYLLGNFLLHFKVEMQNSAIESSEKFEIIISNSPQIFYILDEKGDFLLSRGKGLEQLGLEPDELVGQNVYELYSNYPELLDAINSAYNGEEGKHNSYVKDTDLYFNTSIYPMKIKGKKRLIGIATDVTQIIKNQQFLNQQEMQLQRMQRIESLGNMVSGISHEFNNLLTILQGLSEVLLLDNNITDEQEELINDLIINISRGKHLTDQLLSFGKKSIMRIESVDLNKILTDLHNLIDLATVKKSIELEFNLIDEKIIIQADQNQLNQIFLNILLNAFDAIGTNGKVSVFNDIIEKNEFISRKCTSNQNIDIISDKYVIISVHDNGCGISDKELDRIFDPFYTTKSSGIGLGLTMVQTLIEQYQGKINVVSEQGIGTTFEIMLPIVSNDNYIDNLSIEESDVFVELDLTNRVVLIVEDEPSILSLLSKVLSHKGATIYTAVNGLDALKLISSLNPIDVIISDIKMPKMNGLELYENILKDETTAHLQKKFIFITGFNEDVNELQHFYDNYEVLIIEKPFKIDHLFKCITKILEQ